MDHDSLSRNKIDPSLNAKPSEQPDLSQDNSEAARSLLSQDEINVLLNAVSSDTGSISATVPSRRMSENIVKYDFTMPARLSREHTRALRVLNDSYSRSLGSMLSRMLQAVVEVECTHIEQLSYGEYLSSILDPSCIAVFSMNPFKGLGLLEMNPTLVFPMIDKLLGGSGIPGFYNRYLTNIEENIVTKVMENMLEMMQEVWNRSIELQIKLERLENSPQFIRVASQDDPIVLSLFDVRLDNIRNMMSLCIPFMNMKEALADLPQDDFSALSDSDRVQSYEGVMRGHVDNLQITLSARYESSAVSLGELVELQKGDIIKLQNANKNESFIFVEGRKKLYGKPGMFNGRRAMQIYGIEEEDDLG